MTVLFLYQSKYEIELIHNYTYLQVTIVVFLAALTEACFNN